MYKKAATSISNKFFAGLLIFLQVIIRLGRPQHDRGSQAQVKKS